MSKHRSNYWKFGAFGRPANHLLMNYSGDDLAAMELLTQESAVTAQLSDGDGKTAKSVDAQTGEGRKHSNP